MIWNIDYLLNNFPEIYGGCGAQYVEFFIRFGDSVADPGWKNYQDTGSAINIPSHISKSLITIFVC